MSQADVPDSIASTMSLRWKEITSKPNLQATNSSYRRSGEPLMRRDTVTRGR